MKKQVQVSASLLLLAGVVLGLLQGCAGKIPTLASVLKPKSVLPSNWISDFETGNPQINPNLQGGSNASFRNTTYGGPAISPNAVNNPFVVPNTVPDATDSSAWALHVFAPLIAAGTGNGYESDQLVCPLYDGVNKKYFDASSFTYIQFLINIQTDDTNSNPIFQVAIAETEPPPGLSGTAGGICSTNCFNHFQVGLTAPPPTYAPLVKGQWTLITLNFNNFSLPFGSVPNPPGLNNHLTKLLFLQWQFSDNVQSGASTYTDYWIDDVQFLP